VPAIALLAVAGCRRQPPPSLPAQPPAQVLDNFQLQEMENGRKSMTLDAVQGRLYDSDHHADLDSPFVTFYKNGAISSTMKAPVGRVDMETHAIEAWNGVTVVTSDSATLTTERLSYDPKKKKIFSNTHVHLERPNSVTDGESLVADPGLTSVIISHQRVKMR